MTTEYLKKAPPRQESIDTATSETVERLLADIQRNGRSAVEKYARDLDGWHGPIVLTEDVDAEAAAKAERVAAATAVVVSQHRRTTTRSLKQTGLVKVATEAMQDRKQRAKTAVEECLAAGVYPSDRHLRATGRLNATALQRPETRSYLRTIREALRDGAEDPTCV